MCAEIQICNLNKGSILHEVGGGIRFFLVNPSNKRSHLINLVPFIPMAWLKMCIHYCIMQEKNDTPGTLHSFASKYFAVTL